MASVLRKSSRANTAVPLEEPDVEVHEMRKLHDEGEVPALR
jgi:hypothetical protein